MIETIGKVRCTECDGTGKKDNEAEGEGYDDGSGICSNCGGDGGFMPYVNAYIQSYQYGGPEEGGWYYYAGDPVASVPISDKATLDDYDKIKKDLMERFSQWDGPYDLTSVRGTTKLQIVIEAHFARHYPAEKPVYE